MGTVPAGIEVRCKLSNHNDPQDERDRGALYRLAEEIEKLTKKPEYAEIALWVSVTE